MAETPIQNQTENSMAWDDLRTSPAFPAIVGGLAGAIGGIALMFLFSRLTNAKKNSPAAYDADGNPMNIVYLPPPEQFRVLGFTVGDLMTFGGLGIGLYRQYRKLRRANALELEASELESQTDRLLAPPSDLSHGAR